MALPSTRELELEALVRQRDAQIQELNDDITRLRRHLSTQEGPSGSDSVTLPPPILSVLRPHIRAAAKESSPASSTVVNALIQRSRLLQEENDELYDILKVKETGKLKEEVRGLRRVVERLESGLRESHNVIAALSTELEKSNEALMAASRHVHTNPPSESRHESRSPRNAYRETSSLNNGSGRHPPTGPRAFKKQRLSDTRDESPPLPPPPVPRPPPSNTHRQHGGNMNNSNSSRTSGGQGSEQHYQRHSSSYPGDRERDREQRDFAAGLPSKPQASRPPSNKMDVDDDKKERRRGDRDRQRGDAPSSNSNAYEKDTRERAGGGGHGRERGSGKGSSGSGSNDRAVTISGGTSVSSRDRNRGGGGSSRDHDRSTDNGTSRSSQGHHANNGNASGGGGRRNGTPHGSNSNSNTLSVRGAGRRNDQRTTGPSSSSRDASSRDALDRTLAERMGL